MRKFKVEFEIYVRDNDDLFKGHSNKKILPIIREDIWSEIKYGSYPPIKKTFKVISTKRGQK